MKSIVILYYKFVDIKDPQAEVATQKKLCGEIGLTGRVLIGHEGINGTLEGTKQQISKYKNYLKNHELFSDILVKETESDIKAFEKLKVKYRDEIVTLKSKVNLKNTGKRISREELHTKLENKEDLVLIDMRNDYESAIGRFQNAIPSETKNFRDLAEKLDSLKKYKDKKVITYCTGGIRCEKASALLVENGFSDVYQLDGGIFKYAEKYPDGFFEGKCFVFDNRLSVSFEKTRNTILTKCEHCQEKSDRYIDCVDDICHRLFICCENCQAANKGFCSQVHHSVKIEATSTKPNYSIQ